MDKIKMMRKLKKQWLDAEYFYEKHKGRELTKSEELGLFAQFIRFKLDLPPILNTLGNRSRKS